MGFSRQMDRARAKREYRKYAEAYRAEQAYLEHLKKIGKVDPKTQLERKKLFSEWYKRDWRAMSQAVPVKEEEPVEENLDLEWLEETLTPSSDVVKP